jgi:nitrilase
MRRDQIPDSYEFKSMYPKDDGEWVNVGNSAIVNPQRFLAGPVACKEEIIYAEIDPAWMRGTKFSMDTAGHYARPDIFQLTVNRTPATMLTVESGDAGVNGSHEAPLRRPRKATR